MAIISYITYGVLTLHHIWCRMCKKTGRVRDMDGPRRQEEERTDVPIRWPLVWLSDILPDGAYIPPRQEEKEKAPRS